MLPQRTRGARVLSNHSRLLLCRFCVPLVSFTASIVGGYEVLVNDDKTRSFVCLRVKAGRELLLRLIGRVDPLMRRFNQSDYYEVHFDDDAWACFKQAVHNLLK